MTPPRLTPAEQAAAWAVRHRAVDGLCQRTTLRRDDVDVWTTWIAGANCYETVVWTPTALVVAALALAHIPLVQWTESPEDARAQHEAVCTTVAALLAVMAGHE
jgi:hypothetical protein